MQIRQMTVPAVAVQLTTGLELQPLFVILALRMPD
jgi:hypothetical protein